MTTWRIDDSQPVLDASFPLPRRAPFTLQQAIAAGISRSSVRRLERAGLVRRLLHGVYVAQQVPDSRRLRLAAVTLVTPVGCVVTDWTACWIWAGLLSPGEHAREPVPSVFRADGHDRLRNELCRSGTRTFEPSDLVEVDGLTVTTPLRTAWDLGRLAPRDHAIGAIDALLRLAVFDKDELVDGTRRFKGERGVVQLRDLVPIADPRSESPGESLLRLRWLDLRSLPPPTPQVPILVDGIEVYRLDLGVPELRYACEYDGEAHHLDE